MDIGLRLIISSCPVCSLKRVSILVVVDIGLRHKVSCPKQDVKLVSILVVVDIGLRPEQNAQREREKEGLNPCCSGYRSAT